MLGIIWSIIKSMRYVLPFLTEVTDENDKNITSEDLLRIRQLKKMLSLAIWRIIYLVIIISVIYWGVIPLYTENAVLRQEVNERDKKIIEEQYNAQKARNERRRINEAFIKQTSELKALTEDRDRLIGIVHNCNAVEKQYRDYLLNKEGKSVVDKLTSKVTKTTQTNNNNNKQPSDLPAISDELRLKLKATK